MSLFGGLALLLASIGLFGLMSFNVSRRTNEIGIRMALGAQRGSVVSMVLRESLLLVGSGVAAGIALGILLPKLLTKFITPILFGLPPVDPASMSIAIVLILARICPRQLPPGPARLTRRSDGGSAQTVRRGAEAHGELSWRTRIRAMAYVTRALARVSSFRVL